MSGDRLNAETDLYVRAAGDNVTPPAITSDPLVAGLTPVEQLLRVLGLAANADDNADNADSVQAQTERDIQTIADAEAFAAQDQQAMTDMNGVAAQDQATQLAQQVPQLIAGIAGAITGALGGALQPLIQIPQQIAQAATQTGAVLSQSLGGSGEPAGDPNFPDGPLTDDMGTDLGVFDGTSPDGGDGIGGLGAIRGTAPTALLGPPPLPSAGTAPAAAPVMPVSVPGTPVPTSSPSGSMAGVPMIPPGAMHGGAAADKDSTTDTKRVSVPPVRNGSPVQGRLSVPPVAPVVVKKVDGKPVATKRITGLDSGDADPTGYH